MENNLLNSLPSPSETEVTHLISLSHNSYTLTEVILSELHRSKTGLREDLSCGVFFLLSFNKKQNQTRVPHDTTAKLFYRKAFWLLSVARSAWQQVSGCHFLMPPSLFKFSKTESFYLAVVLCHDCSLFSSCSILCAASLKTTVLPSSPHLLPPAFQGQSLGNGRACQGGALARKCSWSLDWELGGSPSGQPQTLT